MNERHIDEEFLLRRALEGVRNLKEVARNRERSFPRDIQAVLVIKSKEAWLHRIDREIIHEGVGVVREVTAAQETFLWGEKIEGDNVSQDQIALHGPLFVYIGVPEENEALKKILNTDENKLPEENIVIVNEVMEEDGTSHPGHTGDQFKSFFQEITRPDSRLSRVKNIVLVGHYSDFVIYPFYAQEFNRRLRESGFEGLNFWADGIKNREGTGDELEKAQLHRLVENVTHGDLPAEPLTFRISQSDKESLSKDKQVGE